MFSVYNHLGANPPAPGLTQADVLAIKPDNSKLWVQLFFQKLAQAAIRIDRKRSKFLYETTGDLSTISLIPDLVAYPTKDLYQQRLTDMDLIAQDLGLLSNDGSPASTLSFGVYKIPAGSPPELPKAP
jgi:hypothetical protein